MIDFNKIKNDKEIQAYIKKADEAVGSLGYTDHSQAHTLKVAHTAAEILKTFGYSENEIEMVKVAGYIHDIGNMVNRKGHAQIAGVLAVDILKRFNISYEDIGVIVGAIGNHDEDSGVPINSVSAALIIADKTDVRRTRVRNRDLITFDIHDRVNYSVEKTELIINNGDSKKIELVMTIDTDICSVMEYFEIFLTRMMMCQRATTFLGAVFALNINGIKLI